MSGWVWSGFHWLTDGIHDLLGWSIPIGWLISFWERETFLFPLRFLSDISLEIGKVLGLIGEGVISPHEMVGGNAPILPN